MRSLLQVLCVLSALVATGYSLSCTVCESSSGTSCTGLSINCTDAHVCMSSYTVLTAGGIETKIFTRNCEPQTRCGINGSITLPTYKSQMGSSCCTTDNCTPSIPTLPANNNTKNGVTCRTCISADSDYCYTSDTVECTGDEKMCLLQSTKISGSISRKVAIRGCATESICNIGNQFANGNGLTTEVITKCSNGNIGLYQGFFFPAAALLLMKLLS
ncbi:phospholipase A2 inhibitor and Ly6/PLAUR domain-containing protein-like [Ascaphus truei]|uniref:phospholipase A2 inhibitor and Ly6/PLAUR domain-containing protein-like n=1 Tax=Ascaphus truei TaxID=8439 RepID=UPI003F5A8F79